MCDCPDLVFTILKSDTVAYRNNLNHSNHKNQTNHSADNRDSNVSFKVLGWSLTHPEQPGMFDELDAKVIYRNETNQVDVTTAWLGIIALLIMFGLGEYALLEQSTGCTEYLVEPLHSNRGEFCVF